ncbi:hypothetical protein VTJ04DRAFT_3365 [Mycothermus thermophilus]|uniref:uncharacterized protein n=1 Tax=Humicola insolens TaxID=85995 RepID=UPI0037439601
MPQCGQEELVDGTLEKWPEYVRHKFLDLQPGKVGCLLKGRALMELMPSKSFVSALLGEASRFQSRNKASNALRWRSCKGRSLG